MFKVHVFLPIEQYITVFDFDPYLTAMKRIFPKRPFPIYIINGENSSLLFKSDPAKSPNVETDR